MFDRIQHKLISFPVSKFQCRVFLILLLTSLLQIFIVSRGAIAPVNDFIKNQVSTKALSQAKLVAHIPDVRIALEEKSPERLQSLMTKIQSSSGADFIVIGDSNNIRYFHPDAGKIGLAMVGGDNDWGALALGESYTSIRTGSLGLSVRSKAPVMNIDSEAIGVVSVGYMFGRVENHIASYLRPFGHILLFVLLLALFLSSVFSLYLKKQILGMEPENIARLLQERTAIMRSLYEGFVAVDDQGLITAANPSAREALSQGKKSLRGRNIQEFPELMAIAKREKIDHVKDLHITIDNTTLICNATRYGAPGTPYGTVISFRKKEDIELLTQQLSQVKQYVETLRVQAHEYANKLSVISGMIHMKAYDMALAYIESQSQSHQKTIDFLNRNIHFPKLRGLLMGKYHQAQELGIDFVIDDGSSLNKLPRGITEEQVIATVGNLLSNAFEAVQHHIQGERRVTLLITDIGQDLIIEVEDNGPGIPEHQIPEIIRKGVTSKKDGNHGVGLFLINSIITQANGQLLFEPAQPSGAIVTACIPFNRTSHRSLSDD